MFFLPLFTALYHQKKCGKETRGKETATVEKGSNHARKSLYFLKLKLRENLWKIGAKFSSYIVV